MKNKLINALSAAFCGALLTMTSTATSAVVLSLQPVAQLAHPTDTVSLTLTISGLGDFQAASLGDFDIDVSFDPGALTFQKYTLGGFLGDLGLADAVDFSQGQVASGTVNLSVLSFLDTASLDGIQPSTFAIATLDFTVDMSVPGTDTFAVISQVWALGDGFGNSLTVDALGDAVITVVPEASTPVMMILGFAGIGWALRRRRPRSGADDIAR